MRRNPYVAGQFYPSSAQQINKQIESFINKQSVKKEAIACMLPHAGYMFSGKVASLTVSEIRIKERVLLLGPNHTGLGEAYSIMPEGSWLTPLGEVEIDVELAQKLLANSSLLKPDFLAHSQEHSLEVQLPILQYFKKDFKIVPIALLSDDLVELKKLGKEIASVLKHKNYKDSTLILASSDMTHYEPQDSAEKKDNQAIRAIEELDEDGLMKKIRELNISMCGYAPVIVMLQIAKLLGAKSGKLVKYQTSGDVTSDTQSVVGYAGIIIS